MSDPGRPERRRPPRLARALLGVLLPPTLREAFAGDLEERFHRLAATDPSAARRAYWRDVLSPTVWRLRREARGTPLPPGARPGGASGDGLMGSLLNDIRFAFRTLAKSPLFTAVAVLSLALGIGPNTAIFSLVDTVMFQDWGVRDPESVMDIYGRTDDGRHFYTYYEVKELVEEGGGDAFRDVGATAMYTGNIERGDRSELVLGEMVTGNYFDLLGVAAAHGRTFVPEEDATPGTHPVVVLSHRFWQSRYEGDPALVGDEIRLNGRPYTVVGIAPESFRGRIVPGIGTDFWVPLSMYPHLAPGQMGNGNYMVLGRMHPGVSGARGQAVLDAVAARFNEARPERRSQLALAGAVLADIRVHPDMDRIATQFALLLVLAVGLVLLVACVNLAGFLLSRATDRRKEMAVRVAMGAGRGDIVRQLAVESMVLAGLGGALGLVLGLVVVRMLLGIDVPLAVPVEIEIDVSGRLLAFTAGVSVLAALFFGLAPALDATRAPTAATLRDEAGTSGGRRGTGIRGVLVAAQMALSTVLIFSAGLFLRNLAAASEVDVGFDTGPAAIVTLETWASERSPEERTAFAESVLRGVQARPDVTAAALTHRLPLDLGNTTMAFEIPGVETPPDRDRWVLQIAEVSPDYFDVMGIDVVEGRAFDDGDGADGQTVGILSRAAAERFWPGESAVGRVMHRNGDPEREMVIVGVVGNAKIWSLTEGPRPFLYVPHAQEPGYGTYSVVARGPGSPAALAAAIREEVRALDPDMFVSGAGTMADHLDYILFLPKMAALLLSLVGLLALALACMGLYGMVSYSVSRRTREMGIRMALGADRGRVVRMIVRSGLVLVGIGGLLGLVAAVGLGALLEGWLLGIRRTDPLVLLGVPTFLVGVALLASWLPARRASRVDPVEALRSE